MVQTYTTSDMSFFDKMDAIQAGLDSICLYDGVYVLGSAQLSEETPYYGISTSPHMDQDFYIQSPYYSDDAKPMLISYLYPYILDSAGFPRLLYRIATNLEPTAKGEWTETHYMFNLTYNGQTKAYGGAGNGGGQGIRENQIDRWFKFDGSSDDLYMVKDKETLAKYINEYGKLDVPEEKLDIPELTWEKVADEVGKNGSYVRIIEVLNIWGTTEIGYSFFYDRGGFVGFFSDAWYDGRYFNEWEFFEKGTKFSDKSNSNIIIKNPVIKIPDNGFEYQISYYNGIDPGHEIKSIEEYEKYDMNTGEWKDFMIYYYNEESDTWIASVYYDLYYCDNANGSYLKLYDNNVNDDFKKACTLTRDDIAKMNIDSNFDKDPEEYLIYDMQSEPGKQK